jgi:membrane associated rhomboid family serine protease
MHSTTVDGAHVTDNWSSQDAETGGWPPPSPDQQPYGPGTPAGHGTRDTGPGGPPVADGPATDRPPTAGRPSPGYGPTGNGPAGNGPTGNGPDGYGAAGNGPAGDGGAGGPAAGYESSPEPAGPGEGGRPWAPGDSAYGRLTGSAGGSGPARRWVDRPDRPARPWDGRPAHPQRSAPRTRSAAAGTPVTFALIVACVLGYLLQEADPDVTVRYGLIPAAVEAGQYERLITAAFLHAGLLHLATNMLTLYVVGTPLERVLRTGRYLTVYVLSALGGSLLSVWASPQWSVGVGASGAIFGLFGALLVLRRQVGADARGLGVLIGINLVISFTVPNISWQAHVGGLVTGLLVALVIAAVSRARRPVT